eukprot:5248977-Amphidinium_carterae.1
MLVYSSREFAASDALASSYKLRSSGRAARSFYAYQQVAGTIGDVQEPVMIPASHLRWLDVPVVTTFVVSYVHFWVELSLNGSSNKDRPTKRV